MSRTLEVAAVAVILVLGACDADALDHDGRCPTRELPTSFDGEDLGLLRGYTRVGGNLPVPAGTTDLTALRCLEVVDGSLSISSPDIETLEGLENLREVGGLDLNDLPRLQSTAALAALREIRGGLSLRDLPSLRTIDAPADLTRLDLVHVDDLTGLERWEPELGVTELDTIELFHLPAGAQVSAFAGVVRAQRLHVEGADPADPAHSAVVRLDALASADVLILAPAAPESVASLGSLAEVGGLSLRCVASGDLAGLSALHTVGGLEINDSPGVVSLAGLSQLASLTSLRLRDNPNLRDLEGLRAWRTMPNAVPEAEDLDFDPAILLEANPLLADVSGIEGIEAAPEAAIRLTDLPALTVVPSWPTLARIGDLTLERTGVRDLDALAGVTELNAIYVSDEGEELDTQSFAITIVGNPDLADLSGLDSVTTAGEWGEILIQDNPQLSSCTVDGLLEALALAGRTYGDLEVDGNGDGTPCE